MIERDYLNPPAEIDFARVFAEGVRSDFGEIPIHTIPDVFPFSPLFDESLTLSVFETDDSKVFLAPCKVYTDYLVGDRFVHLLHYAVSTSWNGRNTSGIAIRGDWDICLPEVRAKDPKKAELYEWHMQAESFAEFDRNHFTLFWEAINWFPLSQQEQVFENFVPPKFRNLEWILDDKNLGRNEPMYDNIRKYAGVTFLGVPTLNRAMVAVLKEFGYFQGESPYIPVGQILSRSSEDDTKTIFKRYVKSLGTDDRRVLASWIGNDLSIGRGVADVFSSHDPDGTLYWLTDHGGLPEFMGVKIGKDLLEFRRGESYKRYSLEEPDAEGFHAMTLRDEKFSRKISPIVPAICWGVDKRTGGRRFYCEKVDEQMQQIMPGVSKRHDFLLGQIGVLSLSENVRDAMMPSLSLYPGGKPMDIKEAQLPVACDFYSPFVLKHSPFIAGIEALAK